jgi:uncharacterized protein
VMHRRVTPPNWPPGLDLNIALLADLHACDPWMPEARIRQIVTRTNALGVDAVMLLGDFVVGDRMTKFAGPVSDEHVARVLGGLRAPLGVHAILGNHDWWADHAVQVSRTGLPRFHAALAAVGIPVYNNHAVRLEKGGHGFWIAGLGDQWAFFNAWPRNGRALYDGVDDITGTMAHVRDAAPVILMAHEPDIFPRVPDRVALTVCGHTHGGQVRFLGYAPVVPSRFGRRYAYGHIIEAERHLVVSGGLGVSGYPLRFGMPPEIVVVELRAG